AASSSPAGTRSTVVESILKEPGRSTMSAGAGMTPPRAAGAGMTASRVKIRAAVCAAALRSRTIRGPYRTILTLPDRLVRRPTSPLQFEPEVQVVLRAVLVERPRLISVQRIVLEGGIVQVHGIERDREVIVHGVAQRGGQGADGVLRERGASIQAAVERRPIGVGHPGIEHPVLEVPAHVIGILRGTDE